MKQELPAPEAFSGLTEAGCIELQKRLAAQVVQRNAMPLSAIKTVAGVDTAYWQEGDVERAVCCIAVIDVETAAVLETQYAEGIVDFPYIPGCLAFRELPLVLKAAARLERKPDIFLFDGNGILHPRGMGLAAHASFYLDAPTMGVAKRYFRVEGAVCPEPGNEAGSYQDIVKDGRVLGRALRTKQGVRPVYVSVGSRMDLDSAAALALALTGPESHIPIPTRYADLETHIKRAELRAAPR